MVTLSVKYAALGLMVAAATGVALAAGKPPKPVTSVPATATFRCFANASLPPCEIGSDGKVTESADHVGDEGPGSLGSYDNGVLGARFFLRVTGTGRAFRVFLHPALAVVNSRADECAKPGALAGCNPDMTLTALNGASAMLDDAEVSIAVLNPTAPYDDAPGGLTAMACNTSPQLALVHFTAWLPSGNGHWGLNYNKRAYHSTGARITRTADMTWVVEATGDDTAELVSFNHSNIARKSGPSHEGQYRAPFRLELETTALPSGSTSCQ